MLQKYALVKVVGKVIREKGELGLREVARRAQVGPSTAKACLDFLQGQGVVEKRKVGRNHLFRVKDGFLTRSIRILYSLSELSAAKLIEEIVQKNPDVVSVVLYGSVARGEDDEKSDVDLLVISRRRLRRLSFDAESVLRREVSVVNYTHQEWREKAEKDRVFYDNVILHCIVLYGEKPVVA